MSAIAPTSATPVADAILAALAADRKRPEQAENTGITRSRDGDTVDISAAARAADAAERAKPVEPA